MKPSVFRYRSYKSYLLAFMMSLPRRGFGFRRCMAEKMGCEMAYIYQVLNGPAEISLDQAEALQGVLQHSEEEAVFFLLLVQLARTKTPELRSRILTIAERLQSHCQRGRGMIVDGSDPDCSF